MNLPACMKIKAHKNLQCSSGSILNSKISQVCEIISPKEVAAADLSLASFKTGLPNRLGSLV